MFITSAYAQTGGLGDGNFLVSILPFVLIFVVFYFLLIRPQRQKMKQHQAMVEALRRGDKVVTNGGLIGKVTKVIDNFEIEVEIAEDTRVRVIRGMIQEVRAKGEPATESKT